MSRVGNTLLIYPPTPTDTLTNFDWDLELTRGPIISFNDSTKVDKVILNYNISTCEPIITIYEAECITHVIDNVIGISADSTTITLTHSNLKVILDMKQDTVSKSSL